MIDQLKSVSLKLLLGRRKLTIYFTLGIVMAAVSFFTSAMGFTSLMTANSFAQGGQFQTISVTSFVFLLTFMMQYLIVRLILDLVKPNEGKGVKSTLVILLVAAWGLSVCTSYSAWWYIVASDSYVDRATQIDANMRIEPVRAAGSAFMKASQQFSYLSKEAGLRKTQETQSGDSCGYVTNTTKGRRYNLRVTQAVDAQFYSEAMQRIDNGLSDTLVGLDSLQTDAMEKAYREATLLLANPDIDAARSWAQSQISGFDGGFTDKKGKLFECEDRRMVNLLSASLNALEAVPLLEGGSATRGEIDPSTGMLLSYKRIFGALLPFISSDTGGVETQSQDWFPLLIPLVFETIMALLLLRSAFLAKVAEGWSESVEQRLKARSNASLDRIEKIMSGAGSLSPTYAKIRKFVVEAPDEDLYVLIVPHHNSRARRTAQNLVTLFAATLYGPQLNEFMTPLQQRMPVADLPYYFDTTQSWIKPEEMVDLYRIPKKTYLDVCGSLQINAMCAKQNFGTV